jgi:hypothetical protein
MGSTQKEKTPTPRPSDHRRCDRRGGRDDIAPPEGAGVATEKPKNTPWGASLPRHHGRPRETAPPTNHAVAHLHLATTAGQEEKSSEQHLVPRETTKTTAY